MMNFSEAIVNKFGFNIVMSQCEWQLELSVAYISRKDFNSYSKSIYMLMSYCVVNTFYLQYFASINQWCE